MVTYDVKDEISLEKKEPEKWLYFNETRTAWILAKSASTALRLYEKYRPKGRSYKISSFMESVAVGLPRRDEAGRERYFNSRVYGVGNPFWWGFCQREDRSRAPEFVYIRDAGVYIHQGYTWQEASPQNQTIQIKRHVQTQYEFYTLTYRLTKTEYANYLRAKKRHKTEAARWTRTILSTVTEETSQRLPMDLSPNEE
jgi:hypothetical protein